MVYDLQVVILYERHQDFSPGLSLTVEEFIYIYVLPNRPCLHLKGFVWVIFLNGNDEFLVSKC